MGGERVARAVCSLTTNNVDLPICRGRGVAHAPLGFTCPVVRKREKSWCSAVLYVEHLSGVAIVEQDDAGKGTRVATENEEVGGVECGEGMPGKGAPLG